MTKRKQLLAALGLIAGACAPSEAVERYCAVEPYPPAPYGPAVGSTIPDLRAYDLAGQPVALADLHCAPERAALLYLAASWCFTCGPEIAWLNMQAAARPELAAYVVLLQNEDFGAPSQADGERFRDAYGARISVLVDADLAFAPLQQSSAVPLNVVVRTDRMEIVHRSEGFDPAVLDEAIRTAMEE